MLHVKCEKHENKRNNNHKIKTYVKDSYLDIEVGTQIYLRYSLYFEKAHEFLSEIEFIPPLDHFWLVQLHLNDWESRSKNWFFCKSNNFLTRIFKAGNPLC